MVGKVLGSTLLATTLIANPIFLGEYGHTYEIKEPDMYRQIKAKAAKIDPATFQKRLNLALKRSMTANLNIRACVKNRTYSKQFFYTLKKDIVVLGTRLWKKGEKINLLERLHLRGYMLFLDATKKSNIKILRSLLKRGEYFVVVVTKGDIRTVREKVGDTIEVKKAFEPFVKKLAIECVPTLIHQARDKMVFEEIGVE